MSGTVASPGPAAPSEPAPAPRRKPRTDGAAVKEINEALEVIRHRAEEIRSAPEQHKPRLVVSAQVRGTSILDKIADAVNKFCGQQRSDYSEVGRLATCRESSGLSGCR
ncbi:MAG TPA: hypothetical protein VFV41_09290 [Streptosporangiaceae bacterium]|nr:hypothetical protein [Streptosporangiaceae bacterium]